LVLLAAGAFAQSDNVAFLTQFEKTLEHGGRAQAKEFVLADGAQR
jgi:hypothetical protein